MMIRMIDQQLKEIDVDALAEMVKGVIYDNVVTSTAVSLALARAVSYKALVDCRKLHNDIEGFIPELLLAHYVDKAIEEIVGIELKHDTFTNRMIEYAEEAGL